MPRPSILVPALLTLAVTIVRLLGELNGWSPQLFSERPVPIGIAWLAPLFGIWFGWRIARAETGDVRPGRTVLVSLLGIAIAAGWFVLDVKVLKLPFAFSMLSTFGMACGMAFIAFLSWPALGATLFRYGVAARLPVVVLTCIAIYAGWDTHHVHMRPGAPAFEGTERALWLAGTQLCAWIPFTMLTGGITGGLAGMLAARGRAA